MVLVTVVVVIGFVACYVIFSQSVAQLSYKTLESIATSGRMPNYLLDGTFDDRQSSDLNAYIIDIDERSNTCYIDGFGDVDNLTDETKQRINGIISSVNMSGKNKGLLEQYGMRYYYVKTVLGKRIVLTDTAGEEQRLRIVIISFIAVGAITLLAFMLISIWIARIAVKPVEKSWEQQKQLVSDVSHELKTPITVISANADIMLANEGSTIEDQKKWLNYIKDECNRMSALVGGMLYLAKTDESLSVYQAETIDLSELAYSVGLPFESLCFEKGKQFRISIEPGVKIFANSGSIRQLINILLDNAVKYSNDGGSIELRIDTDNDKASISVFNSGNPIPKDDIPKLFDRFYRADASRTSSEGGYGLGLSIARRIIETNSGKISVSSSAEHGTAFICQFKRIRSEKNSKNDSFDFTVS